MGDWLNEVIGIEASLGTKLVASLITVAVVLLARWLLLRAVVRRVDDTEVLFRVRKGSTYAATVILVVAFARIWVDAFGDVATFLGLLSAGIAIALADVFLNLAGWVYIMLRRPFKIGDRVEIGEHAGDVIDIRLFRFTLLEIGNWVDADQSTGRILHVPNGLLFRSTMANYTEAFHHIWHEIPVLVTFESDRRLARRMIEHAMRDNVPDVEHKAGSRIRETARNYHIKIGALTPIVYLTVHDSGVLLTARFLCDARNQRGITERIWEAILDGLDREPAVELAYPTVRTFLHDPVRIASDKTSP
jgi:small-conductance mechanosensitive channel